MADIFDKAEKKLDVFDKVEMGGQQPKQDGLYMGDKLVEELPSWLQKMSEEQKTPGIERQMHSIMGDVAATAIPSPFGKIKAATRLGKGAIGLGNLLFKAGMSAGGSAAGEYVAQKEYGEKPDIGKMGEQALWGVSGEVGTRALGAILKPVFRWASSLSVTGAVAKEWFRKRLIKKVTKEAEQFVKDVAPDAVKQAGIKMDIDDLGVSVSKAFDETKVIYDAYGKHIDALAKTKEGGVILDDTQQLLGELVQSGKSVNAAYGFAEGSAQATILKGGMTDEVIPPDDLKFLLAQMYKKGKKSDWGSITPSQRTARETLKKTILDDLVKASPEAAVLKESGDKAWGEISNFNRVQKMYNSALREMPSGDKYLNPTKLGKTIYRNEKMIKETMPDLWPRLKDQADYYLKMAENWRPPEAKGTLSKVLAGMRMGVGGAYAGAAYTGQGYIIPIAEGFGTFSAWMTLKPQARKILGELVKSTVIKPAAHIGGPMAFPMNFQSMGVE
jgi:hypothetical protein